MPFLSSGTGGCQVIVAVLLCVVGTSMFMGGESGSMHVQEDMQAGRERRGHKNEATEIFFYCDNSLD